MNAPHLGDRDRGGTEMFFEKPSEMSGADPEAVSERVDLAALVEGSAGDQSQGTGYSGRCAEPCRRSRCSFGAATTTGAKSRVFGGGRAGVEVDIALLRGAGRTDRPAIDPRRADPGEEAAVESRIPGAKSPITSVVIQVHGSMKP